MPAVQENLPDRQKASRRRVARFVKERGALMFGKHFASMYSGSMVGLGADVFAVWGYVIGNTKPPGEIDLNPRIVAAAIGMTAEEVEAAIRVLESEDPQSRNKEHDGRRLVAIGPYRYSVVSWSDYRKIRNDDDRREYNRLKQREHRAKVAGMSNDVKPFVSNGQPQSSAVSPSRSRSRGQIQKQERKSSPPSGERMALTEFDQLWEACEKKVAKGEARKAYLALRRKGCDPSLDTLLAALKPLQDSHAWSKDGRQFQPNLATWLRREGWLEKPTEERTKNHFDPVRDPETLARRDAAIERIEIVEYGK